MNNLDSEDDSDEKIGLGLKNLVNNPLFTVRSRFSALTKFLTSPILAKKIACLFIVHMK